MRPFDQLSARGQLGRLRGLAEEALALYGIRPVRLVPLAHLENTTFRVEALDGRRYLLRIHRVTGTPFHPPRRVADVGSEVIWLSALRREAGLRVPEPMPAVDGSTVVVVAVDGVPEPRICVLFRWEAGRFLDARLTPSHLERLGAFMARLHDHAAGFVPPPVVRALDGRGVVRHGGGVRHRCRR
jgi:Ser/Thr protein kinase RdoA (MazF antagonist)